MARVTLKRDGLNLVGSREEPFGEIYDMAILFHGFTANRNIHLLTELAKQLRDENVASVRFDFNGHGESDGAFEKMTPLNELEDANAILEYVHTDPHVRNIFLIGHSQGGVIASMLAGLYPDLVKKVVLIAPAATLRSDAEQGKLQTISYNPRHIPDRLHYQNLIMDGFYMRIAQNLPIYEVSAKFTGPVCLIHGTADKIVSPKASQKYHDLYQNSSLHLLDNADHRLTNEQDLQTAVKIATDFVKPAFY
ncbi:MAG: lysophospholipase [Lactobacillus sp.]|jgi:pimeloyl-ACP methyl ester carboxylesterase|nr:lysophospholipase [Lactobacillus sp.]MCH3905613.1 lysophospholipase [Lactobacillus sp.]MCH3990829.1 lysophospholipase [Lactobacillus sp.]MCH4068455.1 lysophospholipase [Lactobacillus sp.]MCI1304204.1 alpha/beta hydrolase [Lactobacillus sp.]